MGSTKSVQVILASVIMAGIGYGPVSLHAQFTPPNEQQRIKAIGPTQTLAPLYKQIYHPWAGYDPIPKPGPFDWLANQKEAGQTVQQFVHSKPNRPSAKRNTIYIRPLGTFPKNKRAILQHVAEYAGLYFMMDVAVLPELALHKKFTTRKNSGTGNLQILSTDVLTYLRKDLPEDAYCEIAITMTDLYPDPDWNFVFGQASLRNRVGVFSFARYDPDFPNADPAAAVSNLFEMRCLKVFVHETGHMFGIKHCIYFSCIMNGSNHLDESDSRDVHLCPVCLRKLHWSTKFDPVNRYKKLQGFYEKYSFDKEAAWVIQRLKGINP